ncbi:MAG: hypothetical protein QOF96_218, partial [Actinomycetota bacterium]|nr:hypothetical protein [Actinomycetota bacterium]
TGTVTDPTTSSTTSDTTAAGSGETTTTTAPATTSSTPAASDPPTTTAPAAPATPNPSTAAAKAAKGDWAKPALDPLVTNGTITQAQEDAILAALKAARPDHGPGDGHGRGGPGFGNLDAAAKALGMTTDELRTALDGGKTVAGIAKDKGIEVAKVADALVADLKSHLDAEVKDGELTQAQADELLANCRTRIDDFVNGKVPAGGPGGGPGGRGGPGGPGRRGPGGPGGLGGQGGAPANGSGSGTSGTSGTTTS